MKPADLLAQYRVNDSSYSIGPFFPDGVTMLKQQVRALNLVYALSESRRIRDIYKKNPGPSPKKVAVVGGGAAGMTAAVAAAILGNKVCHFEQRPALCHLQAGCDTRWVHPHIYDWPADGSENPYAALPILNWQAGTASEVARCLVDSYEHERKTLKGNLQLYLGATTFISGRTVKWDNSDRTPRGGQDQFDLIVLAVGFGIERGVRHGGVKSYWRNDSLNQLRPGVTSEKNELVFLSGTGDGGLIDLLRSKIKGFNQAWVIDDLFPPKVSQLIKALRAIQDEWLDTDRRLPSGWLFDQYTELCRRHKNALRVMTERLQGNLVRTDINVILNGRDDVFREVLRLNAASLLNTFLTFLLYRQGHFTYVAGESVSDGKPNVTVQYRSPSTKDGPAIESKYAVDRLIIRHGTERDEILRALGLGPTDIAGLRDAQTVASSIQSSKPLWPPGWWKSEKGSHLERGRQEFLPPPTQAVMATFTSTLSNILLHAGKQIKGPLPEFRLTVHRAMAFGSDQVYFQQVAHYAGTRRSGEPARIFKASVGAVGLVCRLGKPVVLKFGADWKELWRILNAGPGSQIRTKRKKLKSIFAFPIFAPGGKHVSLVVYADSQDREFFVADDVNECSKRAALAMLFNAVEGFVQSCNELAEERVLRFAQSSFLGVKVNPEDSGHMLFDKFPKELIAVERIIDGYDPKKVTASKIGLHWDCVYKAHVFTPST